MAHQALEDSLDVASVIKDGKRYARLLAGFWGFHAGFERLMESLKIWPVKGYDPAGRRKSPWLAEDLGALGWTEAGLEKLPVCGPEDLPELDGGNAAAAAAMGAAYVMEGSTLGGRHISAMIARGSSVPADAVRFFQGYGADTGANWNAFLQSLAVLEAASSVEEQNRAVNAARRTFECFSLWMQRDFPSPTK